MASYSEKLKSPVWQRKRLEILQRDEFKCCYCNDTETELQIHHLKYTGEPWEAKNENLITLCKHCHTLVSSYKDLKPIVIKKHFVEYDLSTCLVVKEIENNLTIVSLYDYLQNGTIRPLVAFGTGSNTLKSINTLLNG